MVDTFGSFSWVRGCSLVAGREVRVVCEFGLGGETGDGASVGVVWVGLFEDFEVEVLFVRVILVFFSEYVVPSSTAFGELRLFRKA